MTQVRKLRAGALAGLGALAGTMGGLIIGVTGVGPAGGSQSSAQAQAKRALLVRSDFPSGWSSQGKVTTSNGARNSFPGASQLASCLGVSESLIQAKTPSADSPTFGTKNGAQTVTDSVSVFPSAHFASQESAAISSTKVPGCMTSVLAGPAHQAIVNSIGSGATIGTIAVTAVPSSDLAAHASGFTMSFPVTSGEVTLQASISIVSMVRGKTGSQLTFESVGTPVTPSLMRHLVSVAYQRT